MIICHTDLSLIALIGIILLMAGIVKKNAIMMIDFALEAEREEGLAPEQSIYQACLLRFRPIMMTTRAELLGALPLALESGTGSEIRRPLGIAIVGGLLLSQQFLTLYTTPVIYLYLDRMAASIREWRARHHLPGLHDRQVPELHGEYLSRRSQRSRRLNIRAIQDHASNSIHQFSLMKVDDQTKRDIEQLHVTQQLCLMDGEDVLDDFQFQQQAILYQNVEPQRLVEGQPLVLNWYLPLARRRNAAQLKFTDEALLVNAFNQPRSLQPLELLSPRQLPHD